MALEYITTNTDICSNINDVPLVDHQIINDLCASLSYSAGVTW